MTPSLVDTPAGPPPRQGLLRPALTLFALLSLLTGLLYPLLVTGLAQALFPHQANGSLIVRGGQVLGSELIGQPFTAPGYFWGRPSATAPTAYNGAASGGSNLSTGDPALLAAIQARAQALRAADPGNGQTAASPRPIPIDLLTASASGLDPHISPAAADYQIPRVAQARQLPIAQVQALVQNHTQARWLGFLGEPRVNVLALNLALDEIRGAAGR